MSTKYRPVCTALSHSASNAIHLGQAGKLAMEARYLAPAFISLPFAVCRVEMYQTSLAAGTPPKESQANFENEKEDSIIGHAPAARRETGYISYYSCRPHLQRLLMLLQSDATCTWRCMRSAVHIRHLVDTVHDALWSKKTCQKARLMVMPILFRPLGNLHLLSKRINRRRVWFTRGRHLVQYGLSNRPGLLGR